MARSGTKGSHRVEIKLNDNVNLNRGTQPNELIHNGSIRNRRQGTMKVEKMTSNDFIVNDYYELLALHRVFIEAKFCDCPNDFDVSPSPIVASLHKKLLFSLIAMDVEKKGESARHDWNKWLNIDPSRREWAVAIKRAENENLSGDWSEMDRKTYILDLLSPFNINDELVEIFLNQVN
jgi:hypothetical protein